MRLFKTARMLAVALLATPVVVVAGALTFSQAASASTTKIVCTSLSGNYVSGSVVTIGGCKNGPNGATSATSTITLCQSGCSAVDTWSDASSTTSTTTYNAPIKTGKVATRKCKSTSTIAVASESGKVTAGYGQGGELKATICVSSDGNVSLAPGTRYHM